LRRLPFTDRLIRGGGGGQRRGDGGQCGVRWGASPNRHPGVPIMRRPSGVASSSAMQLSRTTPMARGKRSNVWSSNPAT